MEKMKLPSIEPLNVSTSNVFKQSAVSFGLQNSLLGFAASCSGCSTCSGDGDGSCKGHDNDGENITTGCSGCSHCSDGFCSSCTPP